MLKAVLLDLDNTLVLFDESAFFGQYFPRIAGRFADLLEPQAFLVRLLQATRGLAVSDGTRRNAERFQEAFAAGMDGRRAELWQRFLTFYATDFERIAVAVRAPEGLKATMSRLQASGLPLVVATNPLFPEAVQRRRLEWVGLQAVGFRLVTSIETSSYVKPHPGYYREVAQRLGVMPRDCLMVGNDPVNDMAAGLEGMHTYLTTDASRKDWGALALTREPRPVMPPEMPAPEFQGPLEGVPEVLRRLGVFIPGSDAPTAVRNADSNPER
jgi:FMN phosphatase YigB (HAD superfamily)